MNDFFKGLLVLLALVALQAGVRFWRMRQVGKWCEEARKAMESQNFGAAESALARCLEHAPLWVPGRLARAAMLAQTGRTQEAEEEFVLAASLEPRQPEGHLHLALFYSGQEPPQVAPAIAALEKALECDPKLRTAILSDLRWEPLRQTPQWQAIESGRAE